MSRRITFLVLLMVCALLLCEINLSVTEGSYRFVSGALPDGGHVEEQAVSPVEDVSFVDYCNAESISDHSCDSQFSIRAQTKGRESQLSSVRLLLLFVSGLYLIKIAVRHLKSRLFLPEDAGTSSIILCFIQSKDGKK